MSKPARRKTWREELAKVRAAMRKAERQRGRAREETLVRACRVFTAIPRPSSKVINDWHAARRYRVFVEPATVPSRELRAFDDAAWTVEMKLSRMVKDCVGCAAMRPLPEDTSGNRMRPISPGEVLQEQLGALGLSAAAFAKKLRVPTKHITEILNADRALTPDTARLLEKFFGTSAQFWMNLQTGYDRRLAELAAAKKRRPPRSSVLHLAMAELHRRRRPSKRATGKGRR